MSQKSIASVLLLVAAALGGPVAVDHARDIQEQVIESVAIDGPDKAEVGELVQLKVTGARPSWLPPVDDAYVDEDLCILSFRKPGEYEVVASSVASRSTRVVKHVIEVGKVEPEPVPAPTPTPAPVPEPDACDTDLAEKVAVWCEEVNANKSVCKRLGDNFIYAASTSSTIDELLQKVAQRNRKVNQRSVAKVLGKIQQYLFDNLSGEDFVTHQCAFSDIGQGFLQYAGDNVGGAGNPVFWHGT
jgi:hypothetical protein